MKFLTVRQTAERVGYHHVHIMRLVKMGKFPKPVKLNDFAVRFVDEEIDKYMQERIAERDAKAGSAVA
ncbi:MAG: AlpA family phage regulatory protein [Proteobacteria bacterium]|nr:AlpA family phage regulatory protein [Pseudomonadota bacterium]